MTNRKSTTKGSTKGKAEGSKGKGIRLSDAATVARLFKLQRDDESTSASYVCVGDIINDLLQYADADSFSAEVFPRAFTLAARRVERRSGRVAPAAEKAYTELTSILARLDAGETLEEIEARERERYEVAQEARRAEDLAKPETKDKLSDEWRIWKLRQLAHAFGDARMTPEGREPYAAAHNYARELIRGLVADPELYRGDRLMSLLPQLISIRQEIDRVDRYERRVRAGMKGAQTRKARAAKRGGAK